MVWGRWRKEEWKQWKQVHERLIRQIWGSDNFNWAAVESEGCSGDLLCIWNPERARAEVFIELGGLKQSCPFPWVVGDDFNEVKRIGERKGCTRVTSGMRFIFIGL